MNKGKFGEELAKNFLIKHGYKVITQNFRTRFAEIDIIAEISNTLVFIEVKYRTNPNFGTAEESINFIKLQKIKKAAELFLQHYKGKLKKYRFDIIAINNFEKLEILHYKNIDID